jgi:hypothetical protein
MIKIRIREQKEQKCPDATQNVELNLENRQHAIDDYGYGPPNPEEPNDEFWQKKLEIWKEQISTVEEAKKMLCGNCGVFNISKKMKDCIKTGMSGGEETQADDYDMVVEDLGYCQMLNFKCAASRTCNAWVSGGPIK